MDTLFKTEADKSFGCTSVWLGGGCHCLVAGWRSCQIIFTLLNNTCCSPLLSSVPLSVRMNYPSLSRMTVFAAVCFAEKREWFESRALCGFLHTVGFPWLWQRLHLCSHLSHNFASRPILGAQHKLFHYKISPSMSHLFCGYSSKLGGYSLFWSPSLVSFLFSELDVNPLLFVSSSYR